MRRPEESPNYKYSSKEPMLSSEDSIVHIITTFDQRPSISFILYGGLIKSSYSANAIITH